MAWSVIQVAGKNSAGAAANISQQFGQISAVANALPVNIQWVGNAVIGQVSDEKGNLYVQVGSTITQGSGASQINSAWYVGTAKIVDTVPLTITAVFSGTNPTKRFIGIIEANPNGTFQVDTAAITPLSNASGPTGPTLAMSLANSSELVLVGIYTDGKTQTIQTGWTLINSDATGQGSYYQIVASPGAFSAKPVTIPTVTDMVALGIALISVPLSPAPTPPYGSGQPTSMQLRTCLDLLHGQFPYAQLVDWNGFSFSIERLRAALTSWNSDSMKAAVPQNPPVTMYGKLIDAFVQYFPREGQIWLVQGGKLTQLLYQVST
jgi:hypothetical protein